MRLLIFLAACSAFPDIGAPRTYDEAPGLGTRFADADPVRGVTFSGALQADGVCVALAIDAGYDESLVMQPAELHVFRVDPTSAAATELPALALANARISQTVAGCAVVADDGLAYTSGGAWTMIPSPPVPAAQVAILDGAHAAAVGDSELDLWDGTAWHAIAGRGGIGPLATTGARLVFADGMQATTNLYAWSGAPIGTAVSYTSAVELGGIAMVPNGTLDRFQAATIDAQHRWLELIVFASGAWTQGEPPNGVGVFAPAFAGDTLLGLSGYDGTNIPQAIPITAGHEGAMLTVDTRANLTTCACDAVTDPTCPCRAHTTVVLPMFSATQLAVVSMSDLNSERAFYLRVLPLPFMGTFP